MIRAGWVIMDDTLCQGRVLADWAGDGGPDGGIEYPDLGTLKDKAKELLDLRIQHLRSRVGEIDACAEPEVNFDDTGMITEEDAEGIDEIVGHACDDQTYFLEYVVIEGEGPDAVVWFGRDADHEPVKLSQAYRDAGRNGTVIWPPPDEEKAAA